MSSYGQGFVSPIKSIQQVSVQIAGAANLGNVTINAVNTARVSISQCGFNNDSNGTVGSSTLENTFAVAQLTSTTNLRAQLGGGGAAADTITLSFYITEYR